MIVNRNMFKFKYKVLLFFVLIMITSCSIVMYKNYNIRNILEEIREDIFILIK